MSSSFPLANIALSRQIDQTSPIDDLKKLILQRCAFFHTEFAEIAIMFFCIIQLVY